MGNSTNMRVGQWTLVDVEWNRAGQFEEFNSKGSLRASTQRLGVACGPASGISDRVVARTLYAVKVGDSSGSEFRPVNWSLGGKEPPKSVIKSYVSWESYLTTVL